MTATITHTHEAGTLIEGTARGDGSAEVLKACGWRWARTLGSWYIPQSRDRNASSWKVERTRAALVEAGFVVEIDIDNAPRETATVEADKIERQAGRVEALEARADRKQGLVEVADARSQLMHDRLPWGGEPIKVGHHSEGPHRAAIARADRATRKSVEASDEAKEASERAEAASHVTAARYNPVTVANRIKKIAADLRGAERNSTADTRYDAQIGYRPATPEELAAAAIRWAPRIAEHRDALAFWESVRAGQIAEGTVTDYSRDTIAKGDWVKYWREWHEVTRVNAKSVTVSYLTNGFTHRQVVEYPKIEGHRPAPLQIESK